MWDVIVGQLLLALGKHLYGLVLLAFLNEVQDEHGEQTAVGVAHAEDGLVEVDARHVDTAELELVHDVVEGLLRIEVTGACLVGGERRDAVGQSLLYKVVAQVHIVL